MVIKKVTEKEFNEYGRVLSGYDVKEICRVMKETPLPKMVIYEPSIDELERLNIAKDLKNKAFGGLEIEIGYCNGSNKKLNAVEYHRSSEINIAVTDLILLLGRQQDVEADFTYDTSKIEAFFVPAGTIIEIYGTTLHYAPCNVDENGFRCVVVLPKGTNTDLDCEVSNGSEYALLFAKNKWLIGHPETNLASEGAFIGLKGKNISI